MQYHGYGMSMWRTVDVRAVTGVVADCVDSVADVKCMWGVASEELGVGRARSS